MTFSISILHGELPFHLGFRNERVAGPIWDYILSPSKKWFDNFPDGPSATGFSDDGFQDQPPTG